MAIKQNVKLNDHQRWYFLTHHHRFVTYPRVIRLSRAHWQLVHTCYEISAVEATFLTTFSSEWSGNIWYFSLPLLYKEIPINDKVTPLSSTIFNGASPSNWKMMMLSKTHTLCQKTTFGPNIPFLVPLLVKIRIDFWHEKSLIRVTYFLGFWVEFCIYQKSTFWNWTKIGFLP